MLKKIKILYVIPTLEYADGVTSYAMNYFRNLNNIEIDFVITASENRTAYYEEIIKRGSKVYYIKSNNVFTLFDSLKRIKKFFKDNSKEYDILHCHVSNTGLFYLYYAKKFGIKVRILHSHATASADSILHKIRNDLVLPISKMCANCFFACSSLAGKTMFKNKKFLIINNAIDIEKYKYSNIIRENIRNKLNIQDKFVIGNIGRLCNQKNQLFLVDVFYEIQKIKKNAILIIAGKGDLKEKIVKKINHYGIIDKVIILDSIDYANQLYSAMDLFLLPSLYEGFPVVSVEAQANGVPCIFSKRITNEIKINENICFLPICNPKIWSDFILNNKFYRSNVNCKKIEKFNIKHEKNFLGEQYMKLLEIEKNKLI